MPRLTLRTLLAYIDDTLAPDEARDLGRKVAESEEARALIDRIKQVTRRRRLTTPPPSADDGDVSDANTVAEYLSDSLTGPQVRELEETCLNSDVHLAEVAACHQILTLLLTEPVRVPPTANQRMYKLVEAPASDPRRRPGKAAPVGGVTPPAPERADDDPDEALLLGLKRYTASDTWAGRVGLVAAVGGVSLFLVVAVLMALPRSEVGSPEASPAGTVAAVTPPPGPAPLPPVPTPAKPDLPVAPDPKPADPEKKPDDPVDPKPADPGPKLGDPAAPPLEGADPVGEVATDGVAVVARGPDPAAAWARVDKGAAVRANDVVQALPGYKADVRLATGVVVHLWGNTPEQVPTKPMVMQARVRFHPPAPGFDADLTLDTGRVYLTTRQARGAKVRVRVGTEVWDVALKDAKAEVLVQAGAAFHPDTPYRAAPWDQPNGGEKPRTEARLVVTRGTADVRAPNRFTKFDPLAAGTEVAWDSKKNELAGPRPSKKEEVLPDRVPLIKDEFGVALQKGLADAVRDLSDSEGNPVSVRVAAKQKLTAEPPARLFRPGATPAEVVQLTFPARLAVYWQLALAEGPTAGELLGDLIDQLTRPERGYARQAVIGGLSSWVAQAPGNTEALVKALVGKDWLQEDADLVAHLVRGYGSAEGRDVGKVDELAGYLDHPNLSVREAALGNLLQFYDPDAPPELRGDVTARGQPGYPKFLAAWKERAKVIQERMAKR